MRCFSLCTAPQYGAIPDMWHFLFATVCLGHRAGGGGDVEKYQLFMQSVALCSTIALIHLSVEMNPNALQCSVVKCTALQCILLRTPFSLHRLDHKVNYGD